MRASPTSARVAYVVLAHKGPEQVLRLARRLTTPSSGVFVHLDRHAGRAAFLRIQDGLASVPRAHLLRRYATSWGSFGLVRAPLEGLSAALAAGEEYEFVVLLSAQDYPVRPLDEIHDWLGARRGRSFVHHFSVPTENWADGGVDRFTSWYWRGRILGRYVMFPHPRLPWLPTWRRPLLAGVTPFGGSEFWALSRGAAEYVLEFVRSSPRFVRFFRHVDTPDECFFQTILLNSTLAPSVVDDDLHYVDWSAMGTHPKTLGLEDLDAVLGSGELFARKFDDAAVLDAIDERVHGGRP